MRGVVYSLECPKGYVTCIADSLTSSYVVICEKYYFRVNYVLIVPALFDFSCKKKNVHYIFLLNTRELYFRGTWYTYAISNGG